MPSALKLVGDRYELAKRQRTAIARCACSDQARQHRRERRVELQQVGPGGLWIDGYNVLMSVEAALGGAVILQAHDACYRDMASVHGSYRKVDETLPAIRLLGQTIHHAGVGSCRWWLDRPVSNSGRLKGILLSIAAQEGWQWDVQLVMNPDSVLRQTAHCVATADSVVLDQCGAWVNLARQTIQQHVPQAVVVDLG
jgi:hypothetical protein